MTINLKSLIGKLNENTRKTLEASAGLCLTRTNYDIEVEHYMLKLLDQPYGDFSQIVNHFMIDTSRLTAELTRSLDKLKKGNARTPSLSPTLVKMLTEAWTVGSIEFGSAEIRTGFTVLALVANDELNRLVHDVSKELQKIEPEVLRKEFLNIIKRSEEEMAAPVAAGAPAGSPGAPRKAGTGKTENLDQFTINLTERAKSGKIDPVLGRDLEIRQIVDILMRRRQNNPILTGEAGVGKTAVVEGFAARVASGDVPPPLRNVVVRSLDLALLQAGAGIKGEFENRLKSLIEEVKSSPVPIILFIDEAHTMIGAGGQAGQNDAANLLKPALARGELRTIAATTWSEYKKFFEKDAALARRFQVVKVEEPVENQCSVMLRGIVPALEKHHNVRIMDEGLTSAVRLSHRYLAGRQLPDKAVSILDTACARLALGQSATPPAIEDATRTLDDLEVQRGILEREAAIGANHAERLEEIARLKVEVDAKLKTLRERWTKESELVSKIRDIHAKLEAPAGKVTAGVAPAPAAGASVPPAAEPAAVAAAPAAAAATPAPAADAAPAAPVLTKEALRSELAKLEAELSQVQGENPMMRVAVDAQIVGEVLSAWTGIPVGKMLKNEIDTILALSSHLGKRVIGQEHALDMIAQRVQTSRAALDDPQKPIGVFMLVGPSGVGKTETALALCRPSLRRGAQPDYHQYVGVPGSPYGFDLEGIASRICRLRRGRRAYGSRSPPPLLRWCCWTKWRRPIPTYWNCSTRSSTRE